MGDNPVPDWGSLPVLCWIRIFHYAWKPDELNLLSSLFPEVRRILQGSGFLLEEMDRFSWGNRKEYATNSLQRRLINQRVKSQVELNYTKFWLGQDVVNFVAPSPYQFVNGEKIQQFFEHFSHPPNIRFPFIVPICQVTPSSSAYDYGKAIQLLSTFGFGILHANLGLEVEHSSATPQKGLEILHEMLSHLRNVESLSISMKLVPHVLGKVPAPSKPFPDCPNLSNLNVKKLSSELEARHEMIAPLISSLLFSYGRQISKFLCGVQAFQAGLEVETWNLLENLESCRIDVNTNFSDPSLQAWSNMVEILAQVRWPLLTELTLKFCYYNRIPFTSGLLKAVGNFRESLQSLCLDGIPKNLCSSGELQPVELPKVGTFSIRLCNPGFETFPPNMWNLFATQTPNLKELCILLDDGMHADIENPEFYFQLFTQLEVIFLKRIDGLLLRSFHR